MSEEKWKLLQSKVTEFCLKVTDKKKNESKKSTAKVKVVAPKSALKSKRSEKA